MFAPERPLTFADLAPRGFLPSRAEGPAMPDNPESTWLRGTPTAESPARGVDAPPNWLPPAAAAPPMPRPAMPEAPPEPGIVEMDVIFLEAGVARFGGKDLYLNADEIDHITRHLIDAYSRVQSEERFALITKYLQPKPVEGHEMHEPSGAGQEMVFEMHRSQEGLDLTPEAMQGLRDAMPSGESEVWPVPCELPGEAAPSSEARHKLSRKAARRKIKSN